MAVSCVVKCATRQCGPICHLHNWRKVTDNCRSGSVRKSHRFSVESPIRQGVNVRGAKAPVSPKPFPCRRACFPARTRCPASAIRFAKDATAIHAVAPIRSLRRSGRRARPGLNDNGHVLRLLLVWRAGKQEHWFPLLKETKNA